jgi:hypothetical protein
MAKKRRIKDIDWEAAEPVNTTVEQPVADIDADMDAAIQRFVQNNAASFEGAATAHMISDVDAALADGDMQEDEYRISFLFNYLRRENIKHDLTSDYFNYWYGLSLSSDETHPDKIVAVVFWPGMMGINEELIIEMVPHDTDKEGVVLLSTYAPRDMDNATRLMTAMEVLEEAGGGHKRIYLPGGELIMDDYKPNMELEAISSTPFDDLSESDLERITRFHTDWAYTMHFPLRNQMLMINQLDAQLAKMENTRIIQIQLTTLFEISKEIESLDLEGDDDDA